MKRIFTFGLLLGSFSFFQANAQQEPAFTNYMFNQLSYNPGYAGSSEGICGTMLYRDQYSSFKGLDAETAPRTQAFTVHGPLKVFGADNTTQWLGLGAHLINDKEGFISSTGFMVDGAYHRQMKFGADLGVGLNAGMMNKAVNGDKWRVREPNDPLIPKTSSDFAFDAGLGAYLKAQKFYAGISALHLTQAAFDWKDKNGNSLKVYDLSPVYYLTGGYQIKPLSLPKWSFPIDALIKRDQARTALQLSGRGMYEINQAVSAYGGVSYNAERLSAFSILGGLFVGNFFIGGSLDVMTSQPQAFGPTPEFVVRYCKRIVIPHEPPTWRKGTRTWQTRS